ncbi:MAG: cell division protein FtsZ [Chloroflexi bacterium]|nr:cell division protein FtsZ [Chloroflexota bacterium]
METQFENLGPIRVIGLGGAGANAVDRMIQVGIPGVTFLAANTDSQALNQNEASHRLLLGPQTTRGLGSGGDPALGAKAAEESRGELGKLLAGSEILFLAAGLGGGTGTGASPIVAEIARSLEATVIAVVSKPFAFEGHRRRAVAQEGLASLAKVAHTVISIPNDRLVELIDPDTPLDVAFRIADDHLRQGVQGIAEIVTQPGLINLDLAHIKALLGQSGTILLSMGQGRGPDKVTEAVQSALTSPLSDGRSVVGAGEVLVHILGGPDLSLSDVRETVEGVALAAGPAAEITLGTAVTPHMEGKMQVTILAGGAIKSEDGVLLNSVDVDGSWSQPISVVSGSSIFAAESDLDVPAFIRRRRLEPDLGRLRRLDNGQPE